LHNYLLLAHQGGWDEFGPFLIAVGIVVWWLRRRRNHPPSD
jgi:hypothetical protein